VIVGFAAMRWSHRPSTVADSQAPVDPVLEARLNDELRDLD
jgi:hypothetical protein